MTLLTNIMKQEIKSALGCTEPGAVALAAAKASETLGEIPERMELWVSGNILKNAMNVGIPGTELKGIEIAALLGGIAGRSEYGLEALRDIQQAHIRQAQQMLAEGRIQVFLKDTQERLYIEAKCMKGEKNAEAVISRFHTNISYVCRNDEVLYLKESAQPQEREAGNCQLTLDAIWEYVQKVPAEELSFLEEVITVNSQIAEEGLRNHYGMGVGKHLKERIMKGGSMDFQTYVAAYTAAAADARMAGCSLPVMSTSGSGNQGLTASLPVIAAAQWIDAEKEALYRALALSELTTIHIKEYIGKLSALCGCAIAASIGSACGITYLLGGGRESMEYAVKNMIADISGLICDGAKAGCALKIATSVAGAIQCAYLALEQVQVPDNDGIICGNVEYSIRNLGNLGNRGMRTTDTCILDMMISRE